MKATRSNVGLAFVRAAGMLYPKEKRLIDDPYSEKLLPLLLKLFIARMRSPERFDRIIKSRERVFPGEFGWLLFRSRYIDDVLKNSIAKNKTETVVNLGSGLDCRAYCIPGLENIRYFEVDHPSVINRKKSKLKKIIGKLPDHVIFVPIDFENQSLDAELKKAGYNLSSSTLFIWEGVTQYISKEANESALKYVAQAKPGSNIVFSYVQKGFIDGKDISESMKGLYKRFLKKNNPLWIYGLDPDDIANYLSKYSLSIIEDVGSAELKDRYVKLVNFDLEVFNVERIVLAGIKNS